MPKPKNSIKTVKITIATTPRVGDLLDELVERQMHGKTRSEVADQLIRESLLRHMEDETLTSPPPAEPTNEDRGSDCG